MKIRTYFPSERLKDIVKCYWTLEKGKGKHIERLFPCGETQILFHFSNTFTHVTGNGALPQPGCIISGQTTRYSEVISEREADALGIIFHPYSISAVAHVPSSELADAHLSLLDLGSVFAPLEQRLNEASGLKARIAIIEDFITERVFIPNPLHFSIMEQSSRIFSSFPGAAVKQNADYFSLSERQYERIFKEYVGLSPKKFAGIMRFKTAFSLLQDEKGLTETAYKAGYYDQSHFINSFRKYSGYSPGEFVSHFSH